MTTFKRNYNRLRALGYKISNAVRYAKIQTAFDDNENVKLDIEPDDMTSYENLAGDCFNPDVNTDIQESKLKREEKEFKESINLNGVWGIVGKYFDGENWQDASSVFGFVGTDHFSGYEFDIMAETLDKLNALSFCITCKRAMQAH